LFEPLIEPNGHENGCEHQHKKLNSSSNERREECEMGRCSKKTIQCEQQRKLKQTFNSIGSVEQEDEQKNRVREMNLKTSP
jgi:hypothetical protein